MVAGAASGREFWDDNLKCWRPVGDRRRRRQRRRCSSSSFVGGYGTAATAPCISDKFDEFDCEFETERGYAPLHRVAEEDCSSSNEEAATTPVARKRRWGKAARAASAVSSETMLSAAESLSTCAGTLETTVSVDARYLESLEGRVQLLERAMVLVDFEKLLSAADKALEKTADLEPCLQGLPLQHVAAPCMYDLTIDDEDQSEGYDGFFQFTGEIPEKAERSGARRRRRRSRGRSPRPAE